MPESAVSGILRAALLSMLWSDWLPRMSSAVANACALAPAFWCERLADLDPDAIVRLEDDPPRVVLLDQRRLPDEVVDLVCSTPGEVAEAIRTLAVRGAPAI